MLVCGSSEEHAQTTTIHSTVDHQVWKPFVLTGRNKELQPLSK